MSPEEVKDTIRNVVNAEIKDDPEGAIKAIHDVLAAKMKARINPPVAAGEEPAEEPTDHATVTDEPVEDPADPAPEPKED